VTATTRRQRRFSLPHLAPVFSLIEELIATEQLPGAVLILVAGGEVVLHRAFGWASLEPERRPMRPDTLFDLASLTKVVATTTAVLLLLERGRLHLWEPVGRWLPVPGQAGREIRLWHLLTHTAGLPAWRDFYSHGWSPEEIRAQVYATPPAFRPGTRVLYSDLGFLWLQGVIEEVTGESLADFVDQEIFTPLGMRHTRFCPGEGLRARAAATEYDPVTGTFLCGVVHDENARALGGIAGHAGLFSTGSDLARFVSQLLHPERLGAEALLTSETIALMTRNHTAGLGEPRGLGWALFDPRGCSGGDLLSEAAFGHTGFTGTSIWIDPRRDLAVILLTNRVHLGRQRTAEVIARLRPLVHNAVVTAFVRGS